MFSAGVDALAVVGAGGETLGIAHAGRASARTCAPSTRPLTPAPPDPRLQSFAVPFRSLAMRNRLALPLCAAALAYAAAAGAQDTKVAIGISGWTGFAPLTLAKEAGIFKKNGLDVDDQEDSAEGPPPRDRVGRRAVRGDDRRDLGRLERQRRADHADLPARQELRRRRHGRAQQHREDRRPQGQDRRGVDAPGTSPYFALAWFLKKNGLSIKDVTVVNLEPAGRRAGVRRRTERRGDDLRAVPVDRARQRRRPARSSRPRSTIRW